jgi:hypothetical protein
MHAKTAIAIMFQAIYAKSLNCRVVKTNEQNNRYTNNGQVMHKLLWRLTLRSQIWTMNWELQKKHAVKKDNIQ